VKRFRHLITVAAMMALASPAFADRTQVFTVRPEDGSFCEEDLQVEVKKVKGIKKFSFDKAKLQLAVTSTSGVSDAVVLDAIKRARARCAAGTEAAGIVAPEKYSKDADVVVLSKKGESIGPLKNHLVPGKYTVFDVYADWCGPCHLVDKKLRQIMATRSDIALRKLNLVDFNRPLMKDVGPRIRGLPYVVVFDPKGKRTDIMGANLGRISSALGER
jgi:thiol-disulfide isomerase/thioredoxin